VVVGVVVMLGSIVAAGWSTGLRSKLVGITLIGRDISEPSSRRQKPEEVLKSTNMTK